MQIMLPDVVPVYMPAHPGLKHIWMRDVPTHSQHYTPALSVAVGHIQTQSSTSVKLAGGHSDILAACMQEYWLRHDLPEVWFNKFTTGGNDVYTHGNRSLWDFGNRLVGYASDVYFTWPTSRATVNDTEAWQYVTQNAEGGRGGGGGGWGGTTLGARAR
jgi:hypothetical protein